LLRHVPGLYQRRGKHFPEACLTFDKFHVLKIINEAVDEVRRQEQQSRPELKRTRYIWLKNPENLKENQAATLETLQVKKLNLKTARAYHIRLNFQEFWSQPLQEAEAFLKKWYFWATHSRLEPIKEAAYTIKTPLGRCPEVVYVKDQQWHP